MECFFWMCGCCGFSCVCWGSIKVLGRFFLSRRPQENVCCPVEPLWPVPFEIRCLMSDSCNVRWYLSPIAENENEHWCLKIKRPFEIQEIQQTRLPKGNDEEERSCCHTSRTHSVRHWRDHTGPATINTFTNSKPTSRTQKQGITLSIIIVYVHTMVEPPLPISNREVKHHLAELVLR